MKIALLQGLPSPNSLQSLDDWYTEPQTLEISIDKYSSGDLLVAGWGGSRLHGTDNDKSDLDVRGIYIPSPEELMTLDYKANINYDLPFLDKKVDVSFCSIQEFAYRLARMECNAVELFYSIAGGHYFGKHEEFSPIEFTNLAGKLIRKDAASFLGMADSHRKGRGKKGRLEVKSWKELAHGYRAYYEAQYILEGHPIKFPLTHADYLRHMKNGGLEARGGAASGFDALALELDMKIERLRRDCTPEPRTKNHDFIAKQLIKETYRTVYGK
jgi:predicted nucleotidyltransferase